MLIHIQYVLGDTPTHMIYLEEHPKAHPPFEQYAHNYTLTPTNTHTHTHTLTHPHTHTHTHTHTLTHPHKHTRTPASLRLQAGSSGTKLPDLSVIPAFLLPLLP